MKDHFDSKLDDETTLRFYTRDSAIHGFSDKPPTTWAEVYKTYLTFRILYAESLCGGEAKSAPRVVYSQNRDEGEGLLELRTALRHCRDNNLSEQQILPHGYGTEWDIRKDSNDYYQIFLTHNFGAAISYQLYLHTDTIKELYTVLDNFLEYMLEHSEGI